MEEKRQDENELEESSSINLGANSSSSTSEAGETNKRKRKQISSQACQRCSAKVFKKKNNAIFFKISH